MNKTEITHNKYKKWLAVILAVICLTAAGCGPASGSDTGSEAADTGSGNTTFVPGSFE